MFCYQCEQTLHGDGCTDSGVCGKDPSTAALQDLLLYGTKGVAMYANRARSMGAVDDVVDQFVIDALFTTVTNVSFHPVRMQAMVQRCGDVRDRARSLYEQACSKVRRTPEALSGPATWLPARDIDAMILQGLVVSIPKRRANTGDDLTGLQELLTYGLKGAAAYLSHAIRLGKRDPDLFGEFHAALDFLASGNGDAEQTLAMCLKAGEINLRAMELLDEAHTSTYGAPSPTKVRVEPIKGKAIAVSGHDLKDLHDLLEQTKGLGINVYTHGEMLPAHGYPELRKYPHLVGNYGGPWMNQVSEFDRFPGAILMTTNCIQRPVDTYMDRIFTTGLVAWPGVQHVANGEFGPVIEAALAAEGFTEDGPDKQITVGFGHDAVLGVADQVISAVKSGAIRHFLLIGGCDGAKPGRNYFTELARSVPDDCVIMTLACGKYRFNKLEFGEVAGLPRLLDIGQCNDAYSAIKIAQALASAFGCGVNDLPLSLVLSWYEQKAVAILLTLLYLGIRNIRLGPSLPAFVTPATLAILQEKFNLMSISTASADLEAILAPRA